MKQKSCQVGHQPTNLTCQRTAVRCYNQHVLQLFSALLYNSGRNISLQDTDVSYQSLQTQQEQCRRPFPPRASRVWCATYGRLRGHDQIPCPSLSGAHVNIWRASAVSSLGWWPASSITRAATIFGTSHHTNAIGPTRLSMRPPSI